MNDYLLIMELITRQTLANKAAERWMQQYPKDKDGIAAKIKMLGINPDPDDIDFLIGNKTWTMTPECDECGAAGVPVVQVGEEPSCEPSCTANLCKSCLSAAVRVADHEDS